LDEYIQNLKKLEVELYNRVMKAVDGPVDPQTLTRSIQSSKKIKTIQSLIRWLEKTTGNKNAPCEDRTLSQGANTVTQADKT
jgi:hypothetical protein